MWSLTVDDDLDLVLAEPYLAEEVTELTDRNRSHLGEWEAWARGTATVADNRSWLQSCAAGWARGEQVQTYLRFDGRLVGSAGLRFEPVRNVAELGYWVAAGAEGRGLATRAGATLVEMALVERGVQRVEVRTSVGNSRSRRVAERLGLRQEGILRAAYPIGDRVDDIVLYGLAFGEERPSGGAPRR